MTPGIKQSELIAAGIPLLELRLERVIVARGTVFIGNDLTDRSVGVRIRRARGRGRSRRTKAVIVAAQTARRQQVAAAGPGIADIEEKVPRDFPLDSYVELIDVGIFLLLIGC